jgi:hypothetical protein
MRVVFDENYGEGNEDVGTSSDHRFYSLRGFAITHENQDHQWVTQRLDPSLQGDKGEVRPEDAGTTIEKEDSEPDVVPKELPPSDSSLRNDEPTSHNEPEINDSVERTSL